VRTLSRLSLLLWPACAVAVATSIANAQGGSPDPAGARLWIAHSDQDIVSLAYGLPESDDVPLSFVCDRATKTVTIVYQVEPSAKPDPEALPMELSGGGAKVTLNGKGGRAQLDDLYILEASTPATPELGQVFAQPGTLSVRVDGKAAEFPIDEIARKGAEEIVKGCSV
jgi:hypothetical protein